MLKQLSLNVSDKSRFDREIIHVAPVMKMNHEKTWAMATLYDLMALDYSKVSVADEMLAVFRPKSFFPADKPTILTPVSQKNPPLNEWESQIMAWIQLVNDDPSKIVHETLLKEPIPDSFSFHWTARNFLQKRFLETRDANTWIIASKLALERDTKPDKRFYSPISPEWSCVVDLILESQSCSLQVLEQIASSLSFDSNVSRILKTVLGFYLTLYDSCGFSWRNIISGSITLVSY